MTHMDQINPATAVSANEAVASSVGDITASLLDAIRKHTKQSGESWNELTTLEDVGVDSFDLVELIFDIEDKYGVSINFNANTTAADLSTVGDVARLIFAALAKEARPS